MYRVIFIDDEPWALLGLQDIVNWKELGFEAAGFFSDGKKALEAIRQEKPDVIVTDIRMPEFSGMELIEMVRQEGIPAEVVIISAYRDFEVARSAIRQGVAEYLTKPLKEAEIRQVMERLKEMLDEKNGGGAELPLISEEEQPGEELREFLESAASYPECYVLLSRDGFAEELSELSGKMTPIKAAGFKEGYLYSTLTPFIKPLISGKASMRHPDFMEASQMIAEARLALEGDFNYSIQEQTAAIQFYLASHYAEHLSMKELAEQFHLSEPYLFELFRKNADTTVMNFIRDIRLYHAVWYLGNTHSSIKEIAEKVGYDDPGYFSRLFKKQFTLSPEACRRNAQDS